MAQGPVVKLYAYSQATLKGVNQKDVVAENGEDIKVKSKSGLNYLIYLSYNGTSPVKVTGVWINETAYNVKTESIKKTPVEMGNNNDSKTITLVPKTKNKVLLLTPGSVIDNPAKLTGAKKKAVEDGELVVCYTVKGKKYYKAVNKVTVLEPAVAM